jgi:uncharacterized membrane protein
MNKIPTFLYSILLIVFGAIIISSLIGKMPEGLDKNLLVIGLSGVGIVTIVLLFRFR